MAFLQVNFFSTALMRTTAFHMFLPNEVMPEMIAGNKNYDRPTKTLYLLHGFSGSTIDWFAGSLTQELSMKYNLAIVMPSGENSFYLNAKGTGRAYQTFVGEDLVNYVSKTFGLSKEKEDVYIGGLSMGGFGAIHTALAYPEQFGHTFGLSSALIVNNIKGMEPGTTDPIADYDYYVGAFGDLNQLEESENNPEYLVKKLKKEGKELPSIFMACGTEDFLIRENHEFRDFLEAEGVNFSYKESTGIHDWKFWNEYLEPAIEWMLEE